MSALAVPPTPRLRAVSSAPVPRGVGRGDAGGQAVAGQPVRLRLLDGGEVSAAESGRGHLRLVAAEVPTSHHDGEEARRPALPLESARRPTAVGRPRQRAPRGRGVGERSVREPGVEELAPLHPAVRAARARRERSAADTVATASRRAVAFREGATSPEVPVVLRRLVATGAALLAVVLLVAAGIVASAFVSGPQRTTTATVQSGQSIWDLAAATGADDVAETAARIVELNNLTSSTLQPGQTLIVPAG